MAEDDTQAEKIDVQFCDGPLEGYYITIDLPDSREIRTTTNGLDGPTYKIHEFGESMDGEQFRYYLAFCDKAPKYLPPGMLPGLKRVKLVT